MSENWKPIPGYEGLYEVSDLGRVRSIARTDGRGRQWAPQLIKLQPHTHGYVQVSLNKNCVKTRHYVHLLVMAAFVGPCPHGQECNHKHGHKTDNRLGELEYVTRSVNHEHAYQTLGKQRMAGEKHGNAKLTEAAVREIRQLYATGGITHKQLAKRFHVSPTTIQQALSGQRWSYVR